jgi:hypothetical protein
MENLTRDSMRDLKEFEEEETLVQSYHTLAKNLDFHEPNQKKDLIRLNLKWRNQILKTIKKNSYTFSL